MALVVMNQGEGSMLRNIINASAPADPVLRLFGNNLTPSALTSGGNFTEVVAAGYAPITLTGSSWTIVESGPSHASFATATFTFQAATSVYGYLVTSSVATGVKWAERFTSAPFDITTSGSTISIAPQLTLRSA